MNAGLRFKDIYPVVLFITLLMTWGLVGASKSTELTEPLEWGTLVKPSETLKVCKDGSWSLLKDPLCEENQEKKMVSPLFQNNEFKELLSRLETKKP